MATKQRTRRVPSGRLRSLLALALAAASASAAPTGGATAPARPNVLYLFTDQQHAGMLSCAGNRWLHTPAMDSIARNGARFERAYSANPVCVPARTAMWTGHTPSRFGMESNNELRTTTIPEPILRQTLGRLFRDAGYETAYGGKTHVPGAIADYGFDVITDDSREGLADACAEFLKRRRDRPFFLVASFINPHDICYMAIQDFEQAHPGKGGKVGRSALNPRAPHRLCLDEALRRPAGVSDAEFRERLCPPAPANLEPQKDAPDAPAESAAAGFRKHALETWDVERWRLHRWAYCRLTERVDREIGRVLRALRDAGLEERTLVVLSSDHGDMDGAHRLEHKSVFYEEAARVPFLLSLKGVTPPGLVERTHAISAGLDLLPTLCDYAGIQAPPGLPGRSVRALVEGRAPDWGRACVPSETHYGRMICSGRYKYCVYESGARREELVDLEIDPGEMRNLAADPGYAAILARHRRMMRDWVEWNRDATAAAYLVK